MQLIVIEVGTDIIAKAKDAGAIGVAHQGEATDHLFKSGQLEKVHEFLKQVRHAGMLVGVSTHMPAVVDAIESKGWDVDYYMTCVYERNRSAEELKQLLDHVPIPVSEVYSTETTAHVSGNPQHQASLFGVQDPCRGKVLLASRVGRASVPPDISVGKPTDAVIVGIYDEFSDEPAENVELVRRYGA